jgi:hypothetical protein
MQVAFRLMMLEAIYRLHETQTALAPLARHAPRNLSAGAVMLRTRAARRRVASRRSPGRRAGAAEWPAGEKGSLP